MKTEQNDEGHTNLPKPELEEGKDKSRLNGLDIVAYKCQ